MQSRYLPSQAATKRTMMMGQQPTEEKNKKTEKNQETSNCSSHCEFNGDAVSTSLPFYNHLFTKSSPTKDERRGRGTVPHIVHFRFEWFQSFILRPVPSVILFVQLSRTGSAKGRSFHEIEFHQYKVNTVTTSCLVVVTFLGDSFDWATDPLSFISETTSRVSGQTENYCDGSVRPFHLYPLYSRSVYLPFTSSSSSLGHQFDFHKFPPTYSSLPFPNCLGMY